MTKINQGQLRDFVVETVAQAKEISPGKKVVYIGELGSFFKCVRSVPTADGRNVIRLSTDTNWSLIALECGRENVIPYNGMLTYNSGDRVLFNEVVWVINGAGVTGPFNANTAYPEWVPGNKWGGVWAASKNIAVGDFVMGSDGEIYERMSIFGNNTDATDPVSGAFKSSYRRTLYYARGTPEAQPNTGAGAPGGLLPPPVLPASLTADAVYYTATGWRAAYGDPAANADPLALASTKGMKALGVKLGRSKPRPSATTMSNNGETSRIFQNGMWVSYGANVTLYPRNVPMFLPDSAPELRLAIQWQLQMIGPFLNRYANDGSWDGIFGTNISPIYQYYSNAAPALAYIDQDSPSQGLWVILGTNRTSIFYIYLTRATDISANVGGDLQWIDETGAWSKVNASGTGRPYIYRASSLTANAANDWAITLWQPLEIPYAAACIPVVTNT